MQVKFKNFLLSYQKYLNAVIVGRVLSKFIRWSEHYPDIFNWSKLPTFWRIVLFSIKRINHKSHAKNFNLFSAIFYKSVINLFTWHNNYSIYNYLYSFKSQSLLSFNKVSKGSLYYIFSAFLAINFQFFFVYLVMPQ